MAQIPIGRSRTDFYTVEARLFAGYDDEIPDEAVVIHKVDTTREDRLAQVVDIDNNGDTNDAGARWTVGEIFTERANNIQVSIDAANATGYRVTINTDPATFTTCINFLTLLPLYLWDRAVTPPVCRSRRPRNCQWSAASNTEWIRVASSGRGSGNGSVQLYGCGQSHQCRSDRLAQHWGVDVYRDSDGTLMGWLFEDDMERRNKWLAGAALQFLGPDHSVLPESGTHAWTDSPGGNYQTNRHYSLTSPEIDLTAVESATLTFWSR